MVAERLVAISPERAGGLLRARARVAAADPLHPVMFTHRVLLAMRSPGPFAGTSLTDVDALRYAAESKVAGWFAWWAAKADGDAEPLSQEQGAEKVCAALDKLSRAVDEERHENELSRLEDALQAALASVAPDDLAAIPPMDGTGDGPPDVLAPRDLADLEKLADRLVGRSHGPVVPRGEAG